MTILHLSPCHKPSQRPASHRRLALHGALAACLLGVLLPGWAADPPLPIRLNSTGTGLFYDADVHVGLAGSTFHSVMDARAEDGLRPVTVNAYAPPGTDGVSDVDFAATWVQDDDSSFPFEAHYHYSETQFASALAGTKRMRPISLSGYRTSANETRFAVAWLEDGANAPAVPWDLIVDETSANYQTQIDALAEDGYRPICVSGYSYQGGAPRFSGIFVQDGLKGADWITSHWIPEDEYQDWIDQWWDNGFRPISVSAFDTGGETVFTAVAVRDKTGSKWVARHGMTEAEFNAENSNWTSAANEFGVVFQPLSVAAYRSHIQGGQKRFAAVWRSSPERRYTVTGVAVPMLSDFDDAMEAFMKANDINAASLCVARNGCIQLHRGYTWAPSEFPVTQPDSRFRIASSSKALTATAVMKLLETPTLVGSKNGGLIPLTLDTRVFDIAGMPDLPAAYGPDGTLITIRQLLRHRSGWCSFDCPTSYFALSKDLPISEALGASLPLTRQNRFDFMMSPGLWPIPGDPVSVGYSGVPDGQWGYSNFGFSLLAELIHQISGKSYEDYVREALLIPAGANQTRVGRTHRLDAYQNPREVIYSADQAYVLDSNAPSNASAGSRVGGVPTHPTRPYGRYNIETIDGTGGWVSTTGDLVRFLSSFNSYNPAVAGADAQLLDWNSMWEMWSNPANVSAALGAEYRLGWQTSTVCGPGGSVAVRYHGGNLDGTLSVMCQRSDGISFSAIFSRNQGGGIWTTLNNVACGIEQWPFCLPDPVLTAVPDQEIPACTRSHVVPVSVSDDRTPAGELVLTASWSNTRLIESVVVGGTGSERTVEIRPLRGQSGSSIIRLRLSDDEGRETTREFEVRVLATPVFPDCPADIEMASCERSGAVVVYPAQYSRSGTTAVCTPPSGSLFPYGTTPVVCVMTDECGNQNTCAFDVTVRRNAEPPVMACPPDVTVRAVSHRGAPVRFEVSAFDSRDGEVPVECTWDSGDVFPLGTTVVTCAAEDACGNSTVCTFQVTVERPRLEVVREKDSADRFAWEWDVRDSALEEADSVQGPWRRVIGALSPYRVPADGGQRFFRLVPALNYAPPKWFSMDKFEANIQKSLNDKCVGYSYAINLKGQLARTNSWGKARTATDAPELDMSPTQRINVASVSKVITAVAILDLLEDMPGVDVYSSVEPYLPPDWERGPGVATLTFRDLLTHKSGLAGNSKEFDDLRDYIKTGLGPKVSKYLNSNFALFRVILPYLWDLTPWTPGLSLEEATAEIFQFYVQENIFAPMGINNAWLHQTDETPMLMYRFPDDGTSGGDPGDYLLLGGASGWNLSALDLARFLAHLRYGTVLEDVTRTQMYDERLGWGTSSGDYGTYHSHRGGLRFKPKPYWGVRTCVMDYPNGVQVGLIINSRSDSEPNPLTVLRDAFDDAWVE